MNKIKEILQTQQAHDLMVAVKTIFYLIVGTLIVFGVFYVSNFDIRIEKRVIVSPIPNN